MDDVCTAVWPTPTGTSEACQRRCRDTSQQTSLTHSTDNNQHYYYDNDRQASPPRIKSEHLSPTMTSSSRDHKPADRPRDPAVTSPEGEGRDAKSAAAADRDDSADRKPADRDRVVASSYSVTSRGTSPLDVTLHCPAEDGARGTVTSPELARRDHALTLSLPTEPGDVDRCDSKGNTTSNPAPSCISSLGYEIECITPVDEEPPSGTGVLNSDDDGLSGLDVLSCVASSQVHETCSTWPRRRFSILELPLSQFIDAAAAAGGDGTDDDVRKMSTSPDVISAGYNVPSAGDCDVSDETMTRMSRVLQQQSISNDSSAEQRAGDVFTALKVDVG